MTEREAQPNIVAEVLTGIGLPTDFVTALQDIRELRASLLALEEENAQLRSAILSVNERLAELIVLDATLTQVIERLEYITS